ncbi:MAG TPA: LacI family DNA-binding transcriptional regulator [Solirubrobacteraceae bacterium]|nr:LacI family DNA-binding transcriptional regulator [Solirubrobacteraceae bacterium]
MRDVAETAGVSLKTVSRVINAEPGVAATTAERVTAAIGALGFQRNDLARSLRSGLSSSTLGLVIEDVANPFYSGIAQAVETAARERGFLLITASAREDGERERELVTALVGRRVDALLIVPAAPDQGYVDAIRGRTTFVYIDRPPGGFEADSVLFDDAGGARQAVEHLIAHGHRRIACIADPTEVYTARERLAGYEAALAAAGIAPDPALIRTGSRDAAHAQALVEELLDLPPDRRPTALFTANNRKTVGALHALAARDERLALIGFDDFELADLLGITVVRADARKLGAEAAALAFARLSGDERPPQRVTVPTELIMRGSGERSS